MHARTHAQKDESTHSHLRTQQNTGKVLLFDGGNQTLKIDGFGFRVEANAKLCLYNINLVDGTVCAL